MGGQRAGCKGGVCGGGGKEVLSRDEIRGNPGQSAADLIASTCLGPHRPRPRGWAMGAVRVRHAQRHAAKPTTSKNELLPKVFHAPSYHFFPALRWTCEGRRDKSKAVR